MRHERVALHDLVFRHDRVDPAGHDLPLLVAADRLNPLNLILSFSLLVTSCDFVQQTIVSHQISSGVLTFDDFASFPY